MADQKQSRFSYSEYWEEHTGITFGIRDVLFSEQSEYQLVQVFETDAFGRLLTLDGLVMLTDRDEFVYHEMISHPALSLHANPKRVLVVGGGDGGTVREVLRHPGVERVDLVEIDGMVIEASRKFFPQIAGELDNPRCTVHVADGIAYLRNAAPGSYDVILIDSTDPVGFAEGLFGRSFYEDCRRVLGEEGILVAQTESPFDRTFQSSIKSAYELLGSLFDQVNMYLAHIPTYPTGTWSFVMAGNGVAPLELLTNNRIEERTGDFAGELKYFNADVCRAAFALPNFVRRLL